MPVLKYAEMQVHKMTETVDRRQAYLDNLMLAVTRPDDVRVEESGLQLGQQVRVRHGAMAGLDGRLIEFRGGTRVAINVEVIDKIVSVEVPIADLERG